MKDAIGTKARDVPMAERLHSPALVVVDLQNDFVRPGAPLEVPEARETIAANRKLIDIFRKNGLPIVFTRFISAEQDEHFWLWSPECYPDVKCCWRDQWRTYQDSDVEMECIAVVPELELQSSDIIIDKYSYGAFHGTNLDEILKKLGVRSLVLTGTVTQICVEQTGREAFQHGFRVTIACDAVSSSYPDLAAATLKNFASKFGWVATSDEIVAALVGHD